METADLPTVPPAGRQGASRSQRVIAPAAPLPSSAHFGERQRASLLRQTVQPTCAGSTSQPVSPELARLIEHREQLATQATRQLQALVAVPAQQEKGSPGPAATPTKAEPEKHKRNAPMLIAP